MANGYEKFNPAEQAAREEQEKALSKTLEEQGEISSPDVSGMSGIVQPNIVTNIPDNSTVTGAPPPVVGDVGGYYQTDIYGGGQPPAPITPIGAPGVPVPGAGPQTAVTIGPEGTDISGAGTPAPTAESGRVVVGYGPTGVPRKGQDLVHSGTRRTFGPLIGQKAGHTDYEETQTGLREQQEIEQQAQIDLYGQGGTLAEFQRRMAELNYRNLPGTDIPIFQNQQDIQNYFGGLAPSAVNKQLQSIMGNLPTPELQAQQIAAKNDAMTAGKDTYLNPITGALEKVFPEASMDTTAVDTAPIATTSQQGDADWADEDFNSAWGQVNNPDFDMANIGQYLKFHTPQIEIEIEGQSQLVAGSPVMTDRSRALLDRAVTVEGQKRATEQQAWDRKIQTAQATGKFGNDDTLAKKQQAFDQSMTEAQITGKMKNNANTLARDRLDLEKNIQQADQTGYFDSDIGGRSKTLAREKLDHEKELADAQADLQQASIMGAHPKTGFKTFAKQQWMDDLDMDEKRYDEEVAQRIGDQNQRLLSILGTSPAGAYVRDGNGNVMIDPSTGEPILQSLESRKLTEDIIQRSLDRNSADRKINELVRSNQEAEKIRLIEVMGMDENEAESLATKRLNAQIRAEKQNEVLRDKELELQRDLQAGQMDFQRQQLASQNLALMLQNPAAFGALTALTGGGMPQQLQGLGMQVPTAQQPPAGQQTSDGSSFLGQVYDMRPPGNIAQQQLPAGQQPTQVPTPQQAISQMFQGSVPTLGQLGQLDPQAMQTLTSMLGYSAGIRPDQLGRASAGITPGGIQTAAPRIFGGGMPTGRRT